MFRCLQCSRKTSSHFEQCPGCGGWGTAHRTKVSKPLRLSDVQAEHVDRIPIRPDWDEALGGGAVAGMIVLVYGPPKVGKTSDLLRLASLHCGAYASSERKLPELVSAAKAIRDVDARKIYPAQVRTVFDACDHFAKIGAPLNVLDSWNALERAEPRHVADLRDSIGGGVLFLICHQTKEGDVRGPEELSHRVDAIVLVEATHLHVDQNWHGPPSHVLRDLPSFRAQGSSRARTEPLSVRELLSSSRSRATSVAGPRTDRKARR